MNRPGHVGAAPAQEGHHGSQHPGQLGFWTVTAMAAGILLLAGGLYVSLDDQHVWPWVFEVTAKDQGQITVLNPQSYPVVGGNWTINFRTHGIGDLEVSAIGGTALGAAGDVEFVELVCGVDSLRDYMVNDGVITFEDYRCHGTASLVLLVHTPGIHDMQLGFGTDTAYASNNAYPSSVVEINDNTTNGPALSNDDNFGGSVAGIGDLDGDGVQDLAVGASHDDAGGSNRGAVHIMFMKTDGSVKSTTPIHDNTTDGPALSDDDNFGSSVAAIGDLDGDGVQDLAAGAIYDDAGGSNRGAVHVMFMEDDGSVKSTTPIHDNTTNGPALSDDDYFGSSVAAIGDLDGDGVQDLAAGAINDDAGGTNRGAVHVMFMKTDGSVKGTVEINDTTTNGPALSNNDYFGISVAAIGDLDGDGVQDLAVGASHDDAGGSNRGAVHIMFMNTDGTVRETVEINSGTANGPALSNSDNFGSSVASIGDLDGDGVQDLAAGAQADDAGGTDRGAVHIMFMNTDGSVKGTVKIDHATTDGPALSNNDNFGISVAAIGDLDGDGVQDLAAGAINDDAGGSNRGAVHIMFINDMITNGNGSVDSTVDISDAMTISISLSNADRFGVSVAGIGDLDGDGVQDMAVGARGDDAGGYNRGAVHVMFMDTDGLIKNIVEINDTTANGPVLSDDDYFGRSVASIGDLDGDGVQDLAAGADYDDTGGTNRGAVHIMFMEDDGSVKSTVKIDDTTANGPVLSNNDHFGISVASIGDLDGDGVQDLAAGAYYDDTGGNNRGAVHIMFMEDDGSVKSTVKIDNTTTDGPNLRDNDRFGISVAGIGDLDDDGVQDLAAGAIYDDAGGSNRGAVHIMFMEDDGSVKSTTSIHDNTPNGPVLSDSDYFGRSVAAIGDLDGDGVQDLAAGADYDDAGGSNRGAVHIMFMNTDGSVKGTVEINDTTTNSPALSDSDYFGISVAGIGDLDGDGVQDLAAGAYEDDAGGWNRGALHIMLMEDDGSVKGTVKIDHTTATGLVLSDGDGFGVSVAGIGDLDGDGVQDLAAGAFLDDAGGANRGAVHIMFMDTDGSVKGTVEINDTTTDGPALSDSDYFGISVASIGDLDGDGVQDLAAGAYFDDAGGTDRGAVHIMFMDTDGSVKGTAEINDTTTDGPVLSDSDYFGRSVASIGDLDGDGVQDLAAGAFYGDTGGDKRGAVHIMFMDTDGSVKSTAEINDTTTDGPVLSDEDGFGTSVASIGDLDGDGVQDLAAGATGDDTGGDKRGAVHIMFMNTDGSVKSTVKIDDTTTDGPVLSDGDRFGASVAGIGDLDGDGVQDLAVGASRDDAGGTDRGAVHIMFMDTDGSVKGTVKINDTTTNSPTLSDEDYFGISVASIGDLDGDGVQDLAAGAYKDDTSGTNRGAVHIMFMDKEVLVRSVSSPTPDGTYEAGQTVDITVTFSEPVSITGTPQLTLDVEPVDRTATYLSGSDTGTLTFTYTVQEGDGSPDLQYISGSPLSLNGGTITALKSPNRDAILGLPDPVVRFDYNPPGAFGSLAQNKDIVIAAQTTPEPTPTPTPGTGYPPDLHVVNKRGTVPAGVTSPDWGSDTRCLDREDGDITYRVTASVSFADDKATITYSCTDSDGNTATATVASMEITNTDRPEIFMNGQRNVYIIVGSTYTDAGAYCVDDMDGTFDARTVENPVDTSTPGTYLVYYKCTDGDHNTVGTFRYVYVEPAGTDLMPILTVQTKMSLSVGDTFTAPPATCVDPEDGDISDQIIMVEGNLDTDTPGGYDAVYYICSDSGGNSVTKGVYVTVT